jgi:anthranilate phosphoribosyltransferase
MDLVLSGQVSTPQLASFLIALRMKGETTDEVVGFARAMRERAAIIDSGVLGEPILDTCGTGGDGACTFNISTVAALVVAGAGVRVAKHGNRSISSQCGSADILEELGVNIALTAEQMGRAVKDVGIAFLFAPEIHPAMKHAHAARVELKLRTAFNLLGPLTNPARATVQVSGAPSIRAAELIAEGLATLGLQRGFVVHGLDGLDEITTTTETVALEIRAGAIAHRTLAPEDFGVSRADAAELKGDDVETNARIALAVLDGERGPRRDIVLVNASAALVAAGVAEDFGQGMSIAAHSVDSGAARRKLAELIRYTTSCHTTA